jgi:hypothetical protein
MVDSKDLLKAGGVVAGVAALAAVGFAVGYLAARDPNALRRFARAAAGGLERIQMALAETREDVADLWAEARAQARADVEAHAMAAAEAAAGAAAAAQTAAPAAPMHGEPEAVTPGPTPRRVTARRSRRARVTPGPSHP